MEAARLAAEEEIAFAASLCEHPPQTLLAVQRSVENGEIRDAFAPSSRAPVPQMPTGCTRMPAPLPSMKSKAMLNLPKRSIFSG